MAGDRAQSNSQCGIDLFRWRAYKSRGLLLVQLEYVRRAIKPMYKKKIEKLTQLMLAHRVARSVAALSRDYRSAKSGAPVKACILRQNMVDRVVR
jgi:hypothetical protein